MLNVKLICIGSLKEKYLNDACAEYEKRLGAFVKFETVELKEYKLPENPSDNEIKMALAQEAKRILALTSARTYKIALCVEGNQLSSEELAARIEDVSRTHSERLKWRMA